ncbi:uncharacterized protein LOC141902174 [Tubulanus polymorphus]|uniref:uncharacterized protein LOC141902174 n=1 Tax=Tubulanus polymorphus TaxID=672921 RepID=UPI003DA1F966
MQSPVRPDKKFGELYQATLEKSAKIRALGYNLVEFWEHEYCNLVKENRVFADFVKEVDISDPLLPRDAFFGGRTNAIKIYHKAEDDEKIKYIDICSLYPYVNSRCSYPIGHPTVITENFGDIKDYYGLIKCRILPPRGLYLPILPYRANGKLTFPLCRSCAEDSNQCERCRHSEDERAITGTWVSLEIQKAVELGYRIIGIFEIWNWERSETGLFADYIRKFLKVKTEASGWPSPDMTRAEKDQFLSDYFEREGIRLEENNIKKAKGMRTVAKICLNSMWGKLGQNEKKTTAKYISDPGEMYSMLLDDSLEIQDLLVCNEEVLRVHYRKRDEFVESSGKTSVALAAFATAHARLILYSYMEKLGDRTLYTDTDSIIYTVKPAQWDPPTGNFLGDMTDELADKYGDGAYISEFVSAGPKNYAFRVFSPRDNKFSSECKVKGINLNFRNKQIVNFKSMVDIIVGEKYDHLCFSEAAADQIDQEHIICPLMRISGFEEHLDEFFQAGCFGQVPGLDRDENNGVQHSKKFNMKTELYKVTVIPHDDQNNGQLEAQDTQTTVRNYLTDVLAAISEMLDARSNDVIRISIEHAELNGNIEFPFVPLDELTVE